jgi:predicted GIY-YIG superfamily endonuclease
MSIGSNRMAVCGIYKLNFNGTSKVYIGKGTDVLGRYSSHKRQLLQGTHTRKMMEAYHTYGMPSLEVVLECPKEELNATEDEVIEIYNAVNNGFNTLFSSEDSPTGGVVTQAN